MKSLLTILFALILAAAAVAIVAFNIHSLTTPLLIAAGACIGLAMALAIPAKLETALVIVAPYLPDSLVGGRRKTDPPDPAVVDDAAAKAP